MPEGRSKIVFDRFHIMQYMVEAMDMVRKRGASRPEAGGGWKFDGAAEGLTSEIMTIKRQACGYHNKERFKSAIYFLLWRFGPLPMLPGRIGKSRLRPSVAVGVGSRWRRPLLRTP